MTKIAIKVLSNEHGQKVKNYFLSLGAINYDDYNFNGINEYYFFDTITKTIDFTFDSKSKLNLEKSDHKIIVLPEEKLFPREMLVWDTNELYAKKRIVLHIIEDSNCIWPIVAIMEEDNIKFKNKEEYDVQLWQHAKEIPEEPVETPLQKEFKELQVKIKDLQDKANFIQQKLNKP